MEDKCKSIARRREVGGNLGNLSKNFGRNPVGITAARVGHDSLLGRCVAGTIVDRKSDTTDGYADIG